MEAVANLVHAVPDSLETGLVFRGSSVTEMTLAPGVTTSPAYGEINLVGASKKELLDFRARLLVADDIAVNGMTLAALQFTRDSGYLQDFSVTAINGTNPTSNYVEVEGYRNDDGTFEFAKNEFSPAHEPLSHEPLERFAVIAFIKSIRERSAAPEPATDAPVDEFLSLLAIAPNRLVTRGGEYQLSAPGLDLSVDMARLTREGKRKDLVTYSVNSKQRVASNIGSKISFMMGLSRGYGKRERYRYEATIGMAIRDDRTTSERAGQFEDLFSYYLDNPVVFYDTLETVIDEFADPLSTV